MKRVKRHLLNNFIKNKKNFKKAEFHYGAILLVTHLWATLSKIRANQIPLGLSMVPTLRRNLHSLFLWIAEVKIDTEPWFSRALVPKCGHSF